MDKQLQVVKTVFDLKREISNYKSVTESLREENQRLTTELQTQALTLGMIVSQVHILQFHTRPCRL